MLDPLLWSHMVWLQLNHWSEFELQHMDTRKQQQLLMYSTVFEISAYYNFKYKIQANNLMSNHRNKERANILQVFIGVKKLD